MPKVSIVVPNYNHAPYLKQRLDSVYQQTYKDFEVILLDDFSSDNSREILQQYSTQPNTRLILNENNSGSVFCQWRKGVHLSRGEYIWIAESDDVASPFFLDRLVKILDRNPTVGLAYSQSWLLSVDSSIIGDGNHWTSDLDPNRWKHEYTNFGRDEISRYLIYKNTIPNASAVLIRRTSLEACGGVITEKFRLCGDWMQWIRILSHSDIAFAPECLNFWRQKSSNARVKSAGTLEWIEGEQVIKQACAFLELPSKDRDAYMLKFLHRCWEWQKEFIDQVG